MDLLDFNGEAMYFDEPVTPRVEALLADAAECYSAGPGDTDAELSLLRAYFREPEHLTVLVALYRYFYYRHSYREALITAERAIVLAASRLGLPHRWQDLSEADLGRSVVVSMTLTRFLLLALKGSGFLLLRLGEPAGALERFEKVAEIDTSDRLGIKEDVGAWRCRRGRRGAARRQCPISGAVIDARARHPRRLLTDHRRKP